MAQVAENVGKAKAEASGQQPADVIEVRNPATGAVAGTVKRADVAATRQAIAAAHAAFPAWARLSGSDRARRIQGAVAAVRAEAKELAALLTAEQGKPLRESGIEVERFCENVELYAAMIAGGALGGRAVPVQGGTAMGLVVRRPIGVVGAIIPWNFPLTLLSNKLAPALAVGNTMVVKPASSTPLTTSRIAEIMNGAGLPEGVLTVVCGAGTEVGAEIVRHPLVRKVAFTGETSTGKQVMREAAHEVKRVTLELGGSDAAIVMDDADVDLAAKAVAIGRYFNAGQACLAIKRVFVHEAVADEFLEKLASRARKLLLGPGTAPTTQMGPLHSPGGVREMEEFVADAVARGGRVLEGGKRPEGEAFAAGNYFVPTILVDVPAEARVWSEEVFGPVLPVARVKSLAEAIERTNESEFGLGGSIFTRSISTAQQAIQELDTGYTWVNAVQIAHDELPFGGVKHSGYGKEHGTEVLDFYTEQKSVVMAGV